MRIVAAVSMMALAVAETTLGSLVTQSSGTSSVTLSWQMSGYALSADIAGSSEIVCGDCNVETGDPGEAILPGQSFYVGVPPLGSARVRVVALEVETVSPASSIARRLQDTLIHPRGALQFVEPWVSIASPVRMGQIQTVYYVLRPFVWDERTGTLRVLRKARLEVTIDPGRTAPVSRAVATRFTSVLERLVVNYDVARDWAIPPMSTVLRKSLAAQSSLPAGVALARFRVGDRTVPTNGGLNEGLTEENGLVRIPGAAVTAVLGSGLSMNQVTLYGSRMGELTRAIPDTLSGLPPGVVRIPTMPVDVNGNGRFDDADYLLAWITGPSDWSYNTIGGDFVFSVDRYDDYRSYWLVAQTDSALQMGRFVQPSGPAQTIAERFTNRLYLKRSRLMPSDGRPATLEWIWEKLVSSNTVFSLDLPLVGVESDSGGSLSVFRAGVRGGSTFKMQVDAQQLCASCISQQWYPVSSWGSGRFRLEYTGAVSSDSYMELERVEVKYSRRLDMAGHNRMSVFSRTTAGLVEYRLSGLPAGQKVYVVRVPLEETGISLVDTVRATQAGAMFSWVDSGGIGIRYHISTEAGLLSPGTIERFQTTAIGPRAIADIRRGRECDFLVIHHGDFATAAQRFAEHKLGVGRFRSPGAVDIADIYREFSGGRQDPTAIRDFIWHAKRYWPGAERLNYVVLMGMGHFDIRNIRSQEQVFIPVSEEMLQGIITCNEDYFTAGINDLILGRVPCKTYAEAQAFVDKVVELENVAQADWGSWRNRLLLAADNDWQGDKADRLGHHTSSEQVADTVLARWPSVDIRKVYLFEYEFNANKEMPAGAQALITEINAGVGVVNYFGHGGEVVWADEQLLTLSDLPRLSNRRRYPAIISLSCSVGKFDLPHDDCLSDLLVMQSGAGAIGSISSTREAYATTNTTFGESMFKNLYDPSGPMSFGEAYTLARHVHRNLMLSAYTYLGDPSIDLLSPTHEVVAWIEDSEGRRLDTLKALQQVTIRGEIRRQGATSVDASFGVQNVPAYVQVSLYNPSDTGRRKDGLTDIVHYMMPGSPAFASRVTVTAGRFEQQALLPRSVKFDRTGVRLITYAWQDTLQAVGFDTSYVFHGTDASSVAGDTIGPLIGVRPVQTAGSSGASVTDLVSAHVPVQLEIILSDPSGIDVTGTGPDEGFTIEVPGVLSKRIVNHTFQFGEGDYREGTAPFVLNEGQVQPGRYSLKISARDLLGNMSSLDVTLEVLAEEMVSLSHVFNYPNPMRMREGTRFFYHQASDLSSTVATVTLKIFTLSGKLLRTVRQTENGWLWDGTDQFGNVLTPNVYLWQMNIGGAGKNGDELRSPLRKLVIHPPR